MELPVRSHYHLLKKADELYADSPAQYIKSSKKEYSPFSFREFTAESRLLSKALLSLGAKHGDRIGIIADVGPRWLRVSMAITSIGCVDVPRGSDATADDITYILNHAECSLLFVENEKVLAKFLPVIKSISTIREIILFSGNAASGDLKVRTIEELIQSVATDDSLEKEYARRGEAVKPDDLATIIYTSGTTGVPKGVMLTHGSMLWEVATLHTEFVKTGVTVGRGDITMGFLPPWHSGERMFETICFYSGAAVAFTTVAELARDLKAIRPTFLFTVPRVWENFYGKILDQLKGSATFSRFLFQLFVKTASSFRSALDTVLDRRARLTAHRSLIQIARIPVAALIVLALFPAAAVARLFLRRILAVLGGRVRFAFAGAGALQPEVDRFFHSIGLPLLEVYGMTENSGVSTIRHLNRFVTGTVGRPLTGVEIRLVNDRKEIISEPGIKGVALHRGPHNMKGYYREPEKTDAIIDAEGWLNSGDLLMWTAQGDLKFAGRAKDTIVLSGGENVEPEPIENSLKQSEYFTHVVVVGQDRKTLGALIVPNREKLLPLLNGSVPSDPRKLEETLNTDEEIARLVREEIKKYVSQETGYKAFERVTTFHLLGGEFAVNDELTQTQKVKRNRVQEKYSKEIDRMFS